MRVSVIIPTYNRQAYVLQTLESVFAQSFEDYEIIVVNDGSPDQTAQVLAPLAQAGRIRYIEQPNAGQAAAGRNRGLAQARGEFIAFLDDDDLWPPDKLQWQVAFLDANPDTALVAGAVQLVDAQGQLVGQQRTPSSPVTFESLFSGCPFFSPGQTLIRNSDLREVGDFDERLWGTEDYDLWFRLARCGRIMVLPRLALLYRTHPNSITKNQARMFSNCLKVGVPRLKQAPRAQRARFAREFNRWLYQMFGRKPLLALRIHKSNALPTVLQNMPTFFYFVPLVLRDRVLLRQVLQDLTPHAMQPVLRFLARRLG